MLQFKNNTWMIETVDELPNFFGAETIYLDFETSSGNPKLDSLNPWHNCKVHGFAITVDDVPEAYYIPYSSFNEEDKARIRVWLAAILMGCNQWINQNIKYDAHVCTNDLGINHTCWLVCTLTLSKIIDSDRIMRGGYGLDALSLSWLGEDISEYYNALLPYLKDNKDFGRIPHDIIAPYNGQDILTTRRLVKYINSKCPEQCYGVWDTEIELTRNLWQMERNGLPIHDVKELKLEQFKILNRLCKIDDELTKLVGFSFNPASPDQVYEVLCVHYGLPIIAYTKNQDTGEFTNNASFDKHALKAYGARPDAPKDVIKLVEEFRELSQYINLFVGPWQSMAVFSIDDQIYYLHSTYNQAVRTGRMSCSEPNAQQLSKRAKKLIKPRKGYAFISIDYSQIEFRFIVHYIEDIKAIQAYCENPDTDFHILVAGWCEIPRQPAKGVNFGIAFGEGKKKLIKQLAANPELCLLILNKVKVMVESGEILPEQAVEVFSLLSTKKGEEVYNKYHDTFPSLKPTMKAAESSLKQRYSKDEGLGYVFNMYGRRRHLPYDKAYRAFNTLNQSSAADLMKERLNAACRMIDGLDIRLIACVHDEILFEAPIEIANNPQTIRDLVLLLENPPIKLRVPIRCSVGISEKSWYDASTKGEDMQQPFELNKSLLWNRQQEDFGNLDHLRVAI